MALSNGGQGPERAVVQDSQKLAASSHAETLLALHQLNPQRYPYLLESAAENNARTARYSLLFAYPSDCLALSDDGLTENGVAIPADDFLMELNQRFLDARIKHSADETPALPFNGGWFIYLGYELAEQVEPRLNLPAFASNLPIAFATRCAAAVIVDHVQDCIQLVVEPDHPDCVDILRHMQADMEALSQTQETPTTEQLAPRHFDIHEDADQDFFDSVTRIQEYIRSGDVFQVNLSREWRLSCDAPLSRTSLYRALRRANPAPFAGCFDWYQDDSQTTVMSSSPERLISVRGDNVETRPIAGTRPRTAADNQDQLEREALITHPKERAEHIMLIDLERNDLGRVCEAGTIEVDELMGLESYSHVHHIVSNVRGKLCSHKTPVDALRAVFPGGTITGCPKVHCMEIIAELEQTGRGPYTGAMGYLDRYGNMDMNILIRSLVLENKQIRFRAGAGIVADSDPHAELQETRAKARGLLKAFAESA